jgi:hypothetical protein
MKIAHTVPIPEPRSKGPIYGDIDGRMILKWILEK